MSPSRETGEGADVVVIGGGPVGLAFASEVVACNDDARVVVLEAGPILGSKLGSHIRDLTPVEHDAYLDGVRRSFGAEAVGDVPSPALYRLDQTGVPDTMPNAFRARGWGGMGSLWRGVCPAPVASERTPLHQASKVQILLDEASERLGASTAVAGDDPLVSLVGEKLNSVGVRSELMPVAAERIDGVVRWHGTNRILSALEPAQICRISVQPMTYARRIDDRRGLVEAVCLATGTARSYESKIVFVAANAFESPALLYRSGCRLPALGRYLNDHLKTEIVVAMDGSVYCAADGIAADIESLGVVWVPAQDGREFHGQVMSGDFLQRRNPTVAARLARLSWFAAKDLDAGCSVTMDADDLGPMPVLRTNYAYTEGDRRRASQLLEDAQKVATLFGRPVADTGLMPGGSSLHYLGTTRMGEDDATSVCSRDGLVWGAERIYVGGGGVIETSTRCNPTLYSVALALNTAHAVITRLDAGQT